MVPGLFYIVQVVASAYEVLLLCLLCLYSFSYVFFFFLCVWIRSSCSFFVIQVSFLTSHIPCFFDVLIRCTVKGLNVAF